MKKTVSLVLSAILLASALVSCGTGNSDRLDPAITLASSDAQASAAWLDERLEEIPNEVVLGIGSDTTYGIDMAEFESDGYIMRELNGDVLLFGKTADGLDRAVRKYAKSVEAGQTSGFDEVYHEGYRVKSFNIAGRDISEYTIYYPADKNENMLFAISELQRLVEKACGVKLTAVEGEPTGNAIEFRFSYDEALRNDGYKYTVTDTGIIFEGAVKRGSMYAVWRFLENECGWTDLMYGDSYLLPTDYLNVEAGTEDTTTPAFDYFNPYHMFYDGFKNERRSPNSVQNSYGIISGAMHGMQTYNFDDSGECGIRQPCYTDEDVYAVIYGNVLAQVQSRIAAGAVIGQGYYDVDISQGDTNSFCKCQTCLAVFREEGATEAGAVVRFANKLSEDMNEADGGIYKGLMYKIFAYEGTAKPPKKTAPNDYVHITFCYDRVCVNHCVDGTECHYIKDLQTNRDKYAEYFADWQKMTKNIYVWFYGLPRGLQAITYIDNIYNDFRYFAECGIAGIFWEAEYYGLNLGRVEKQLGTALLWDIDMTPEEFEALYFRLLEENFGDGWYELHEYIKLWNRAQDHAGCYYCWGWDHMEWNRYNEEICAEQFDLAVELFEKAISMANSAQQEKRCIILSCHMLYQGCFSSFPTAYEANDTERLKVLEERYATMVERLTSNGFVMESMPNVSGPTPNYPDIYTEAVTNWKLILD